MCTHTQTQTQSTCTAELLRNKDSKNMKVLEMHLTWQLVGKQNMSYPQSG